MREVLGSNGNKDQGKHHKDERLDKSHEHLKEQKRQRYHVGDEEGDDSEEHLPREDVAEQPERKRNHFSKFGDKFKDADDKGDGAPDGEEPGKVLREADRDDAQDIDRENSHDREREREVKVGRGCPEERHKNLLAVEFVGEAKRTYPRQEAQPIRDEDEQENGSEKRYCRFS